LQTIKRP